MRRIALLLIVAVSLGCSRVPPPEPMVESETRSGGDVFVRQAVPSTLPGPVHPPGPPAAYLFPSEDKKATFLLRDRGQDERKVEELLLRDGDRVTAVLDSQAYATWLVRPDGVWRADPHHPDAMLRYLPPHLRDGMVWQQQSGGADVWFRLREAGSCGEGPDTCWDLTVLNRNEQTVFRFAPEHGVVSAVATHWAEPERSFAKYAVASPAPVVLTREERERLLVTRLAPTGLVPVVEATTDAYTQAAQQAISTTPAGVQLLRMDLNADGQPDLVRGRFGEWNADPLELFQADGTFMGAYPAPEGGTHRAEPVAFRGMRRPAFLLQVDSPRGGRTVTILEAHTRSEGKTWHLYPTNGWMAKASWTQADRVTWSEEGTITVEWDMQDPARHTRAARYRWVDEPERSYAHVRRESVSYRPELAALVYPDTPRGVLQAAWVARWYNLADELPRYFASPEAAAAFAADDRIYSPNYRPGEVKIGQVLTPYPQKGDCFAQVEEAEPQGEAPLGFVASWDGFEWCAAAWGRVSFTTGIDGRILIDQFEMEGLTGWGI